MECEIPTEFDDDDGGVVSIPVVGKGEVEGDRRVANSTVEKPKKRTMAKGGIDATSRDESCVGVGIDAECPIEDKEELLLLSSTTREVEVEAVSYTHLTLPTKA